MNSFALNTIEEGRLDKKKLESIVGGVDNPCTFTASCSVHSITTCFNAYRECSSNFVSCTGTEAGQKTLCGTSNTYEHISICGGNFGLND